VKSTLTASRIVNRVHRFYSDRFSKNHSGFNIPAWMCGHVRFSEGRLRNDLNLSQKQGKTEPSTTC
jgi:hypothetical protein